MNRDTEYKTFKQWNDAGRFVKKGEKSHKKSPEGTPMFARSQTETALINLPHFFHLRPQIPDNRESYEYDPSSWEDMPH